MFKKLVIILMFSCVSLSMAAATPTRVLMILTGASELALKNGETYKTGYWLEEFATPYQIFEKNGFDITIATPKGNRPTVDHGSAAVGENGKPLYWPTLDELNNALAVKKRILDEGPVLSLAKISDHQLAEFDAVFFPGGHGPMADMLDNKDVARVLKYFHKNKKTTALVCHAPAVLVSTKGKDFPYKGYKVTAFTDAEESQTPVGPKMKITPEALLKKEGANFEEAPVWQSHVVEDRELITGQNPASSKAIAEALVTRLKSH